MRQPNWCEIRLITIFDFWIVVYHIPKGLSKHFSINLIYIFFSSEEYTQAGFKSFLTLNLLTHKKKFLLITNLKFLELNVALHLSD